MPDGDELNADTDSDLDEQRSEADLFEDELCLFHPLEADIPSSPRTLLYLRFSCSFSAIGQPQSFRTHRARQTQVSGAGPRPRTFPQTLLFLSSRSCFPLLPASAGSFGATQQLQVVPATFKPTGTEDRR